MVFSLISWGSGKIGGGTIAQSQTVSIATNQTVPTTSTPATVGAGVDTSAARVVEASADASTDRSGTITSGGTAQNAMAANTSRRFWALANNSDTVMMVRVGGTASATAGVKVNIDDLVYGAEIDAISVFCATTGKAFTAWEY